jgi:site-specific recombinase XerD
MYISDLINDYLEYLEIERGRAKKTTENYYLYLTRMLEYGGSELKPTDLTDNWYRRYRIWLNNEVKNPRAGKKTLTPRTQSYHLIALRNFLKYLAQRKIETLDSSLVVLPKVIKPQLTFLTYDEVIRILNTVDENSTNNLRDRAIIELLFTSGARVSELANLNRDSIDFKRLEARVRGKGSKDRPIFISKSAANKITEYLETRDDKIPALFLNSSKNTGGPDNNGDYRRLSTRSIERIVEKYARLSGITKKVTPHTFRHSFATDLLMNGADIRAIQQILGHADISTTQIYATTTDAYAKDVHKRFHTETHE